MKRRYKVEREGKAWVVLDRVFDSVRYFRTRREARNAARDWERMAKISALPPYTKADVS